ncbi:MAG: AmmeMemoRadiSam system protein A [Candidatus Omnitrophica bacterium]|nr:AmmeMemoRadiSam system protein A [Candidatus Omnitrophota bacterium]
MIKRLILFAAVVGAILFPRLVLAGETNLTAEDKSYLVKLARQTLEQYLKDKSTPVVDEAKLSSALKEKGACFVTLEKKQSGLRGCMGTFSFGEPIYKTVIDRAIAAATGDPRFSPVSYDELKDIKVEISVLTVPKELPFSSPEDLLSKLVPLRDGVVLTTRYGGSTFLPQVWEQLPNKEEFLCELSMKHGAPPYTWRDDYKNVKVETYEAIVFGEEN